ncbi:MAG: hypothetical protein QOI47_1657, partial [Actinomycetota bacterium]|nr:hypothetical protein [Actinomycetota bacterium]
GWPDALAAGPWCGRLSATAVSSPSRVLEPVAAATGESAGHTPSHAAVPILLVPAGAAEPTAEVGNLLARAFAGSGWCRGGAPAGCRPPGFAVAFGGTATVSDALLRSVSAALAGGDDAQRGGVPALTDVFRTELDLSPVFGGTSASGPRVCAPRDALAGARWLAVYRGPDRSTFVSAADLVTDGGYDATGATAPMCVALPTGSPAVVSVAADGEQTTAQALPGDAAHTDAMSNVMVHDSPLGTSGDDGTSTTPGATTSWQFQDAPSARLTLRQGNGVADVQLAEADLRLVRREVGVPAPFRATLTLDLGGSVVTGVASGEALFDGRDWALAGRFSLPGGSGGFRGTLDTNGTAANDDDLLSWRVDASVG